MHEGKDVGHLTSPLRSPWLGVIALVVLHHSAWTPNTVVKIDEADGEIAAAMSELPFTKDANDAN